MRDVACLESVESPDFHYIRVECLARDGLVAQFVAISVDCIQSDSEEAGDSGCVVNAKAREGKDAEFGREDVLSGCDNALLRQEQLVYIIDEGRVD